MQPYKLKKPFLETSPRRISFKFQLVWFLAFSWKHQVDGSFDKYVDLRIEM